MAPNLSFTKVEKERGYQMFSPSIFLPKACVASRDVGYKFAANPMTDTGSMTVPIATISDRSGFELLTTPLCLRVLMFHHFPNEAEVIRKVKFVNGIAESPPDPVIHNY